ncbi:hypothetical protein Ssi02_56250 [Sinosporangium siamense]|uniref:Short C-terminal domain-containing protein n=2 Tax=Sinosporangium siamense TaxID=1367973 RepID=A0A919RNS8_9ACTN|nr:hypothetical protein Ssi02_56250 [Sinosporangium siamense]
MAEIYVPDGNWTFDGEIIRIVPTSEKNAHEIRRALGEIVVPLAAVAAVSFEPARKGGWLRLRMRPGADPLSDLAMGQLTSPADPYRLSVPKERTDLAEYFVDEVRNALLIHEVPSGPCDTYLMPRTAVPVSASAGDGTVTFDGEQVRLEWTGFAREAKSVLGPQSYHLTDVTGVEWAPQSGLSYGCLRFHLTYSTPVVASEIDPRCLSWGVQRYGGTTLLVGAAVLTHMAMRTPEPPAELTAGPTAEAADQEAVMRRLTALGELHRNGLLTEEEFTAAKQPLLRRLTEF